MDWAWCIGLAKRRNQVRRDINLTVTHRNGSKDKSGGNGMIPSTSSRTFNDVFIGRKSHFIQKANIRSLKFSYVESSTKEWLACSAVGRLRNTVDLRKVQEEAMKSDMFITTALVGVIYCIISFLDMKSRDRALRDNINWFTKRSLDVTV